MKKIILFMSILSVGIIVSFILLKNQTNNLKGWIGTYEYCATFEHAIDDETNYFIGYTIEVYKENDEYYARIYSNGWQICSESLAYISGRKDKVDFLFIETLEKDSRYGKSERYNKDDILLSFSRYDNQIETSWGILRKEHPVFYDYTDEIVGEYFIKVD